MRTESTIMKTIGRLLCVIATACLIAGAQANPIQDPIADYLAMQVPERSDFIGTLDHLDRAKIDVDGDGTDEVFIGAPYKYSGTMVVFSVGYKSVEGGYQRFTPADKDITIGSFETIYAGPLTEISKQGLATADDIEVDNPQSGNVTKVGMLRFYYITNGQLVVEERGELDLAVPAQKAAYNRYFGPMRQSRKATSIESFNVQALQQMGYTIPNWGPPPP